MKLSQTVGGACMMTTNTANPAIPNASNSAVSTKHAAVEVEAPRAVNPPARHATGTMPGLETGKVAITPAVKAEVRGLDFHYGKFHALKGLDLKIYDKRITALIGPSGCGKSTLLRCFNRMHDLYPDTKYSGEIVLHPDGLNLVGPGIDPITVRMRISMVFQKPNPFPKSIFENVAFGPRLRGIKNKAALDAEVRKALEGAALWEECKDRLQDNAYRLSGGQQQRLCIARALASDPEVILFDEPTSALDPVATLRIEELMRELREKVTIIVVTHNMHQASRVSDYTAFMYLGKLVEYGETPQIFQRPKQQMTEEYIMGRFG
jgi:phosphate transport system ATP-binding protein